MAARTKSKVTPKYKTKYRVRNWAAYEESLRRRGDITVWFDAHAVDSWNAPPSGRSGGQKESSDVAIETALTLRSLFHLGLRQTEGFVGSLALRGRRLRRRGAARSARCAGRVLSGGRCLRHPGGVRGAGRSWDAGDRHRDSASSDGVVLASRRGHLAAQGGRSAEDRRRRSASVAQGVRRAPSSSGRQWDGSVQTDPRSPLAITVRRRAEEGGDDRGEHPQGAVLAFARAMQQRGQVALEPA